MCASVRDYESEYGPECECEREYEREYERMKEWMNWKKKTRVRAFFFRKIVLFFKILHVARDFESSTIDERAVPTSWSEEVF